MLSAGREVGFGVWGQAGLAGVGAYMGCQGALGAGGRGSWGPARGLGSSLGLSEAGGDAETRVWRCLCVVGMERWFRDPGTGASASWRCFVRQGGGRT